MTTLTKEFDGRLELERSSGVPFTRLVAIELRKMTDTKAGFWLLLITGLLLLLTMGLALLVVGLNDDLRMDADIFSQIMTIPVSLLLPVFPILVVTSEWGQRTSLVTFTLEPRRPRVIGAKLAAVGVLAVATIAVAIVCGALGNLMAGAIGGYDPAWNLEISRLAWLVVNQVFFFVMAFAFGMLFLNTPGAISVYYIVALLLPLMVYGTLMAFFEWARDLVPWLDLGTALTPLVSGRDGLGQLVEVTGTHYAQVAVTTLIWVVTPAVVGFWRVLRAEVK